MPRYAGPVSEATRQREPSSNPTRSGPYNSLRWTVDAYPEALRRFNGRSVDEARWGERVRDPAVMRTIGVDAVIEKLDAVLGGG